MRHQCQNCFNEFFDDAPSSSPPARVFCVFCGKQVRPPLEAEVSAIPFSASYAREESFALGVIGAERSEFPDTLRQFRAHGVPRGSDSLAPVHAGPDEASPVHRAPPWRLRKFWTALAVGFGVGASAALLFGQRGETAPTPSATGAAAPRTAERSPLPAAAALSGCVASPRVAAAAPAPEAKPRSTPLLEKRFWLERARSAQHNYRLAEAERFYLRALAQAPRDSEVLSGLGEIELLRGRQEAADARFREALHANSDYVPARVALADLQWQAGQTEAARSQYRQLMEEYTADLLPSHVSGRLDDDACAPQCAAPVASPAPPPDAESAARSRAY